MRKWDFDKVQSELERRKKNIPEQLNMIVINFFKGAFKKQGWTDEAFVPWQEVNRRTEGTKEYRYAKRKAMRTQPILIQSRNLFNAVQNSLKNISWEELRYSVDVPYADYINEGTDKMPPRKFFGDSVELDKLIMRKIEQNIDAIFS